MSKVRFISSAGIEQEVEVLPGLSLMEAAVQNGVDEIEGECGGSCICATCHVFVDAPWFGQLPGAESAEAELLSCIGGAKENSRLCCQIQISEELEGMTVRTPSANA